MEIAIIVVFLAIFGGFLFLAFLIWLIFRRFRKSSPSKRSFESNSNQGVNDDFSDDESFENDSDESFYVDSGAVSTESPTPAESTAYESAAVSENLQPATSANDYAPPADYSSVDSGASYDSGGASYDSGSSDSSTSSTGD